MNLSLYPWGFSELPIVNKNRSREDLETFFSQLKANTLGNSSGFWSSSGWKKYTYLDHTASGKSVKLIEDFINEKVLPHYANTHTIVSHTSFQTTSLRNEARRIIRQSVGANEENDEVIFCGSGATSAVHKLLHSISYPKTKKLLVFVGPFEHHSNILPWREAASKVIQIPLDHSTGQVDKIFLRQQLGKVTKSSFKRHLIVGCFSAGSNLTGALTDDVELTRLMHEFGGLAVWDYAAAAPHVIINMNPISDLEERYGNSFKDAIFFSGHKFLGGPQTPGVLVVKKHILQNPIPHGVGGGTVLFTTKQNHQYLQEFTEREEGGTPDIIGSIRLGLVFRLRNLIDIQNIIEVEAFFCRKVINAWGNIPEIHMLGCGSLVNTRLPIISFMIKHVKTGYFLHHNYVVALLNDLFGIQCRGGCMCAGPYAQSLLGIDDKLAVLYSSQLKKSQKTLNASYGTLLKPGFVRISLNFHMSRDELEFVIETVKLIARYGWRLLPSYKVCWETACFISKHDKGSQLISMESFDHFADDMFGSQINSGNPSSCFNDCDFSYMRCLKYAEKLMKFSDCGIYLSDFPNSSISTAKHEKFKISTEKLRWFMLPHEAVHLMIDEYYKNCPYLGPNEIQSPSPFKPLKMLKVPNQIESPSSVDSIPHCLQYAWSDWNIYYKEDDDYENYIVKDCYQVDFTKLSLHCFK